jgi:hypothetical protein
MGLGVGKWLRRWPWTTGGRRVNWSVLDGGRARERVNWSVLDGGRARERVNRSVLDEPDRALSQICPAS